MNDSTKRDTPEQTPTTPTPTGWNAAETKKLAEFEQASRARSAANLAKRPQTVDRVVKVTTREVADPTRRVDQGAPTLGTDGKPVSPQVAARLEKMRQQRAAETPKHTRGGGYQR